MTSLAVIENKLSFIEKYLTILSDYRSRTLESIVNDITITGALERHIYLVIQATIDCAEAIIALKNLRKPTRYREAFEILAENKVISGKLQEKLSRMVGFRNVITHGYADVDYKILYRILTRDLRDIKEFIRSVEKYFKF